MHCIYMGLHEMETTKQVDDNNGDEEYIDMELSCSSSSSSGFMSSAVSSPPHSRDFEFQMCSSAAVSGEPTTSPADELFYKGQLLPLHLPPRLQMVQKLLESSSSVAGDAPVSPRAAGDASVSPCESRRLNRSEIVVNPDENFIEISTELKSFIESENPRSTWSKKIKQSSLTQKLKASRAYIRSLFSKPGCSDSETDPKSKLGGSKSSKSSRKMNPFAKIESLDEFCINRGYNGHIIHRRSFSGVIQRHCQTKCSSSGSSSSSASSLSSSFSFGSNGSLDLQALMRSSSASSETDNSIEGAIAHCKQSFSPRKSNVSESELCSSRSSVSGEQERT